MNTYEIVFTVVVDAMNEEEAVNEGRSLVDQEVGGITVAIIEQQTGTPDEEEIQPIFGFWGDVIN